MLRKLIFVFLIMLSFSIPAPTGRAEANVFDSEEMIIAFRKNGQPEEAELVCTPELYQTLSENDFYGLYRLLVKAGVDYSWAGIRYSESDHTIEISDISYTGIPAVEVRSAKDAQDAIRQYISEGSDFILLCSNELLTDLIENHLAEYYAAVNGFEDFYLSYISAIGLIHISDCEAFPEPWMYVEDYAQFAAAVSDYAKQDITDFYIVFEPALYEKIQSDAEMKIMTASSKLAGYGAMIYSGKRTYNFYGAEFTDTPREICRNTDDVLDTIRRMGASGISDFELVFPDTDIFDALAADDYALLHEIQARAGMTSAQMSVSYDRDRIFFSEAEIISDVVALSTLEEAIAYTESLAAEGSRDIHLFCTAELFSDLMGDLTKGFSAFFDGGMTRIYDLLVHAGIDDFDISFSEATHLINIHVNHYFPGTAIMHAIRSGDSSGLTERESELRQAAEEIALEAMKETDPVKRALFIHDWICGHVVYTIDEETDEDDYAIGAILNGEANCDGYTDAFYLIGSLAGLNIRYQHGDSLDKSALDKLASITHVWNLLETDGEWRMVDVTMDDMENGQIHAWFNAGEDIAGRCHKWNKDMTLGIAPETVRTLDFENEFYVHDGQDPEQLIIRAKEQNLSDFYILFEDPDSAASGEGIADLVTKYASNSVIHYFRIEKMGLFGFQGITW